MSRLPTTLRLPIPRPARRAAPAFAREVRPDAGHFAAPVCRNCGAALEARFCGECGQEKATRLGPRAVGGEAWQAWRWFEWEVLRAAWRLLSGPGYVAREFVLGARKRHVHPFKLLLLAAGVLVLVLAQGGQVLSSDDDALSLALARVEAWSNWSFSFGIVAMFVALVACFPRRGYNTTERLVLAVHAQIVVLGAAIANHLPTLVWRAPEFLALHAAWSPWFMNSVGVVVLMLAVTQFFALDSRRAAVRLLLAAALYLALKWLLLQAYGALVVRVVFGPSPSP